MTRGGARIVAALLVCTVSGCSFAFTRPPRRADRDGPHAVRPTCSTSVAAPVGDTLFALAAAIAAWSVWSAGKRASAPDENSDGNIGAFILGGIAALAGALVSTGSTLSAGYGYINAGRCKAAGSRPGPPPVASACETAFLAIGAGTGTHTVLPAGCGLADAERGFPSLEPAPPESLRHLGHSDRTYDVWVATAVGGSASVQVWLDGDVVVAVHLIRPTLLQPWSEQQALLGAPDLKLDYRTGDRSFDQWVYPDRGLAVVAEGDVVTVVALFPPTTIYDYEARLALGVAP